jgi:cell division transport system permease protein
LTPGRELQGVWNAIPNLARYDSAGLLMQHLKRVGANIRSAPFTFLVTVLTTALALLLLAFGIALMANLSNAVTHAQASLEMSIYLNDDVPTSTVQSMTENLRRDPDVESVQFRDKAEALALFRTHLGNDATLLEGLDTANPLPASLEVRLLGDAILSRLLSVFQSFCVTSQRP